MLRAAKLKSRLLDGDDGGGSMDDGADAGDLATEADGGSLLPRPTEAELHTLSSLFRDFDVSGDGIIDLDEFQMVMQTASRVTGRRYSQRAVSRAFRHADTDGSGGVDFHEFMKVWRDEPWMRTAVADAAADHARSRPSPQRDPAAALPPDGAAHTSSAVDADELRELVRLFPLSELDSTGAVQLEDFSAMMRSVCTETSLTHRLTAAEVAHECRTQKPDSASPGLLVNLSLVRRRRHSSCWQTSAHAARSHYRRRRLPCNLLPGASCPVLSRQRLSRSGGTVPSMRRQLHCRPRWTATTPHSSSNVPRAPELVCLRLKRAEALASQLCAARLPEEAGLDLSLEDLEQMRLTFAANDVNKDGVIDLPEFEQMMVRLAREKGKRYSTAQAKSPDPRHHHRRRGRHRHRHRRRLGACALPSCRH